MASKPTPAQIRYLRNASAVMDAGTGDGNAFGFFSPCGAEDSMDTADECERMGWVKEDRYWQLGFDGGTGYYTLTPAGRKVLEEADNAD